MLPLFSKLTSRTPEVRQIPFVSNSNSDNTTSNPPMVTLGRVVPPAWLRLVPYRDRGRPARTVLERPQLYPHRPERLQQLARMALGGTRRLVYPMGDFAAVYSFGPWVPLRANWSQLPFRIESGLEKKIFLCLSPRAESHFLSAG